MIRPTKRTVILGMVLLLTVAACGDDAADPERFCEITVEIEQQDDFFEFPSDEARVAVGKARNLVAEMMKVAPDEIRSAVEILAGSYIPILDFFEEAGFDSTQLDEAELEEMFDAASSDETEAAGSTLEAWADANCAP